MRVLYLNNSGSRWIFNTIQLMVVVVRDKEGILHTRKVREWRSFGNFSSCLFKFKGEILERLPNDTELMLRVQYKGSIIDRCPVVNL